MVEGKNESQQVQGEGQHPEEWHAGNVLGHVIADGQQHHRGQRGERQPGQLHRPAKRLDGRRCACLRGDRLRSDGTHRTPGRGRTEQDQSPEQHRPGPAKLRKREVGLEQDREADEGEQRSKVGQGEQAIGHRAPEPLPVPRLEKRRGRGEQEVRQADGRGKQQQNAPDRLLVAHRFPARRGSPA